MSVELPRLKACLVAAVSGAVRIALSAIALWALLAALPELWPASPSPAAAAGTGSPGGPLTRSDPTPFPPSTQIVAAQWTTPRYDPPPNQSGDILPTVWSDNGSTYVLMDDGGVDVQLPGGLWRQSLARISGSPPTLRFQHVGNPSAPLPRTWAQIGANPDNDDGPLGPYYSIGLTEADGIFYATQQRDWNWAANGTFTGLVGIAYSRDHGNTWQFVHKSFPAPLGNLSFVDPGGPGGTYPDGYVYAIGTEREFNASKLVLGRVRLGVANITDPSRWQWYAGDRTGPHGTRTPIWGSSVSAARPVIQWGSHITYPQMSYDAPLHRYLLTFTYSYSSQPPDVWKGGAELVILEAPNPWGPFSFVAGSKEFGPSNGYGAGFPSEWISRDGRDLWLKWAANFDGCNPGLDCSGKYGFNLAQVHLTVAKPKAHRATKYAIAGSVTLLVMLALSGGVARRGLRDRLRRAD